MTWLEIQKLFPANEKWVWLNNAGTTPASTRVLEAMANFLEGYSQNGLMTTTETFAEVKKTILEILSGLLSCESSELSLIHNTAEGMNYISHALSLNKGDKILLLEDEFPSNVYPWEHWKSRGVQVEFVSHGYSPEEWESHLMEKIDDRVRVISISPIHWCTGIQIPLKKISAECEKRGIHLIIDGAQGVGLLPLNLTELKVSAMAFPAWKWLLGPLGLGVLYVRREKLEEFPPIFKGSMSVPWTGDFLPYRRDLKNATDRFEMSTPNFNDWVYFKASLTLLSQIGFKKMQGRIRELALRLAGGALKFGYQLPAGNTDPVAGIVSLESPKGGDLKLVAYLEENGVVTAPRLGRVRFSPHVYNSEDQIDRTLQLLGKYAG